MTSPNHPTIYFAYGSNLHLSQMLARCPQSLYLGLGYLPGYRWVISPRGYANIVPSPNHSIQGLCYLLSPLDEISLDKAEGVPLSYEKHYLNLTLHRGHTQISGRGVREVNDIVQSRLQIAEGQRRQRRRGGQGAQGRNENWEEFLRLDGLFSELGEKAEVLVYIDIENVGEGRPRKEYKDRMRNGIRDAVALGCTREYFVGNLREAMMRPDR